MGDRGGKKDKEKGQKQNSAELFFAVMAPAVQADHEADCSDLPLRGASCAHQNPRSMQFPMNSRDLRGPVVRQS